MKDPSDAAGDNYCGIRTPQGGIGNQTCTEIDLMEANTKAFQSTLYGRHGLIDTSRPFNVSASFDAAGAMRVTLEQGGVRINNFNSSSASNPNANRPSFPTPTGVPPASLSRTAHAMARGMVLVMSLWGGFDKLQNWLNGPCDAPYEPCPWPPDNQTMRLSGLQLLPNRNRTLPAWGVGAQPSGGSQLS
uniref:Cellulase n=1 Tax=Haptolina ericina TaxID=156174 RepID=A0A6T9FZC6_9EUKA|mmetsp:Transcript_35334/g.80135  ORF Transcript_35334/g.80135 Transcript_35334/m.80135 type:complete len:189 (+) Transcript_35334:959-1525(+)